MALRVRGKFAWLLFVLLLVVPIVEITVLIMVGRAIGGWQTFGLLLVWSLIGAWIVKREWRTAWRGLRESLQTGGMPARELSDAALVLIGGTLLLAPGFVTDVFGLLLVLPFTRPLFRGLLQAVIARRILAPGFTGAAFGPAFGPTVSGARGAQSPRSQRSDDVIEGEILDED
ncbi:FxsA family protein [Calidifontibacter terrae]